MDIRNLPVERNELLELTDFELAGVNGGHHRFSDNFNDTYSPGSGYSPVSNSFNPGTVTQIAYANSYVISPSISLLGKGSSNSNPTLIGSAQASNYYNYSVGYQGQ